MGNAQNTKQHPHNLVKDLDQIATKYILTSHYKDLANLERKDYCDKLVILTSRIFNKFLDQQDVKYLEQRMDRGVLIDKMSRDKLIYFDKSNLKNLDVKNSFRKKRMCIGIARFYVKVGHIFAAILKTINPEYIFTDDVGQRRRVSILDKDKIPRRRRRDYYGDEGESRSMIKSFDNNLCSRRIKALTPKFDRKTGKYNIRVCKINKPWSRTSNIPGTRGRARKFNSEVGIPELRYLYLDVYDYGTGQFTKMSDTAKKEYKKDVATFYKAFTGNSAVPKDIDEFSKIPLADFHNRAGCQENGILSKAFTYEADSSIYIPYAEHLKNMLNNAKENQNKLIAILGKIFVKKVNRETRREEYTLNPLLTRNSLNAITVETRKLIMQLYLECEKDFRKGIKLFEALVEKKEQMRNDKRRANLEKEFNNLLK
jgi:hypothetical protein